MDHTKRLTEATKRKAEAETEWRQAIKDAATEGKMTRRAIAKLAGISHQRVQQIVHPIDVYLDHLQPSEMRAAPRD